MYMHLNLGDLVTFPHGVRLDMLAGTVVQLRDKFLRVKVEWAEMDWDRKEIGRVWQIGYKDVELAEWNQDGMNGGQMIEAETIKTQRENV